jgi:hypothetical protein
MVSSAWAGWISLPPDSTGRPGQNTKGDKKRPNIGYLRRDPRCGMKGGRGYRSMRTGTMEMVISNVVAEWRGGALSRPKNGGRLRRFGGSQASRFGTDRCRMSGFTVSQPSDGPRQQMVEMYAKTFFNMGDGDHPESYGQTEQPYLRREYMVVPRIFRSETRYYKILYAEFLHILVSILETDGKRFWTAVDRS